jgi:hypothetical protein
LVSAVSTSTVSGASPSNPARDSVAAVAGIGVGSAIGEMLLLAVIIAIIATRLQHKRPPRPPPKQSLELPGFQIDAIGGLVVEISPIPPSSAATR